MSLQTHGVFMKSAGACAGEERLRTAALPNVHLKAGSIISYISEFYSGTAMRSAGRFFKGE